MKPRTKAIRCFVVKAVGVPLGVWVWIYGIGLLAINVPEPWIPFRWMGACNRGIWISCALALAVIIVGGISAWIMSLWSHCKEKHNV